MSDIVERLRAENERLIHDIQAPDGYSWQWHCARKDDEIERLRKTLDDHLESEAEETRRADRERDKARKLEAELGRLRDKVADIEAWKAEGEAMVGNAGMWVKDGNVAFPASTMFRVAEWWANRPWGPRDVSQPD